MKRERKRAFAEIYVNYLQRDFDTKRTSLLFFSIFPSHLCKRRRAILHKMVHDPQSSHIFTCCRFANVAHLDLDSSSYVLEINITQLQAGRVV